MWFRASRTLRRHGMPPKEIRAVVSTDDPRIVHRYLELHRERLEEQMVEQRRVLGSLERTLTEAILERNASTTHRLRLGRECESAGRP